MTPRKQKPLSVMRRQVEEQRTMELASAQFCRQRGLTALVNFNSARAQILSWVLDIVLTPPQTRRRAGKKGNK